MINNSFKISCLRRLGSTPRYNRPTMTDTFVPPWDEQALALVAQIEQAVLRQGLHSQGQFIALTNALEMQLESGEPDSQTVTHLSEALLCLARARGLDLRKARLPERLEQLRARLAASATR